MTRELLIWLLAAAVAVAAMGIGVNWFRLKDGLSMYRRRRR